MLPEHDERYRAVLDRLVRERVHGDFAYFFVTGEGEFMPDGIEQATGCVIDREGQVFSFWLGWDDEEQTATLKDWKKVKPQRHWEPNSEYRRARTAVGLSREPSKRASTG
jgi:hypothetical protein